jgi:hypothetical protein
MVRRAVMGADLRGLLGRLERGESGGRLLSLGAGARAGAGVGVNEVVAPRASGVDLEHVIRNSREFHQVLNKCLTGYILVRGLVPDDPLNRRRALEEDDGPEVIDCDLGGLDIKLVFRHLGGKSVGEISNRFLGSVLDFEEFLKFDHFPVLG